jgi:hypothetical protein
MLPAVCGSQLRVSSAWTFATKRSASHQVSVVNQVVEEGLSKARLLGPIDLFLNMFVRDTFRTVILYRGLFGYVSFIVPVLRRTPQRIARWNMLHPHFGKQGPQIFRTLLHARLL